MRRVLYGLFLLSRLLGEDSSVWEAIRRTMDDFIPDTLGIVTEFYDSYDPIPFGLSLKDTVAGIICLINYIFATLSGLLGALADRVRAR